MKKKIQISVLLCIAVLSAGLTGCVKKDEEAPTQTPLAVLQGKVATLEGWQGAVNTQLADKPTRAEMNAAITAGTTAPDLTALTARVTALEAENAALDAEIVALAARVVTLEGSGVVTPTPSGEVTVQIVEETPLLIMSSSTGFALSDFTVRITNNTDSYKYVGYSIMLTCASTNRVANVKGEAVVGSGGVFVVTKPSLTSFGYAGLEFSPNFIPTFVPSAVTFTTDKTQQILFTPKGASLKISVAAGATRDIHNIIELQTVDIEQWEGSLTGVVVSTTY